MKKRNGFTLVELLVIIVILAIIAAITIPLILNVIENSKKKAAVASAFGYIDAIEKNKMNNDTEFEYDNNYQLNGIYTVENGTLKGPTIEDGVEIPVTGTKPSYGELTYLNEDFQKGCLTIKEYKVELEEKNLKNVEKGICEETPNLIVEEFPKIQDSNPGVICGLGETEDYDNSDTCYIYSVEDLVQFSNLVNSGKNFQNKTVILMNNLDIQNDKSYKNPKGNNFGDVNEDETTETTLKAELTKEESKGFKPIGNSSNYFSGTFDGNTKKIKNLYINRSAENNIGLFGYNTGTIKGL